MILYSTWAEQDLMKHEREQEKWLAPAFGVLLFALVAWTMFAALATGEDE